MQELEFRVWSDYWKKYATEAELYMDGLGDAVFETEDGIPHHENTDLIIELFTGLRDKNGKKIYEGDIVQCYDPRFKSIDKHYGSPTVVDRFYSDTLTYEILGNIHENSELLEKK